MRKTNRLSSGLKERLSLILCGDSSAVPDLLADLPIIRLEKSEFRLIQERLGLDSEPAAWSNKQVLSSLEMESVTTPWVLLLEEGEEVDPKDRRTLLEIVSQEPSCIWDLAVERLVEKETLSDFDWVTTRDMCQILGKSGRIHYLLEPRLIPQKALGAAIRAEARKMERRASLMKIRRQVERKRTEPLDERPSDLNLFLEGHFRYFDDTRFCPHFQWPWTSYLTMRQEHIPALEKGITEGWGNPEMAAQALSYLIRFGQYEKGYELSKKMPQAWLNNHAGLSQLAALVTLASGRIQEAEQLLADHQDRAFSTSSLRLNRAKILLVLGREEKALQQLRDLAQEGKRLGQDASNLENLAARIEANLGKRASLCVCILARDEEASIENCISSIRGIADEILVVDTGSFDRTKEIALSLGARVESFPWSGDFSAARNFGLEKATCDYVFMLDADEYISPEQLLNLHVFKALLPVGEPLAFRIPIAHIQTRHNWLIFVRAINPKLEKESVRIFPSKIGALYKGRIEEEIETSLAELGIPIANVTASDLTVFHDPFSRNWRVKRKLPIYEAVSEPSLPIALAAVGDYASAGDTDGLLRWLWLLHDRFGQDPVVWTYCLKLARFMEIFDLGKAESLYRELVCYPSVSGDGLLGLAGILAKQGRLPELPGLDWKKPEIGEMEVTKKAAFLSYQGMAQALLGDLDKAADLVKAALEADPSSLLAQAVRFFLLISVGALESALFAIQDMAGILHVLEVETRQDLDSLVQILEKVSRALLVRGLHAENSILLASAERLETIISQEVQEQQIGCLRR